MACLLFVLSWILIVGSINIMIHQTGRINNEYFTLSDDEIKDDNGYCIALFRQYDIVTHFNNFITLINNCIHATTRMLSLLIANINCIISNFDSKSITQICIFSITADMFYDDSYPTDDDFTTQLLSPNSTAAFAPHVMANTTTPNPSNPIVSNSPQIQLLQLNNKTVYFNVVGWILNSMQYFFNSIHLRYHKYNSIHRNMFYYLNKMILLWLFIMLSWQQLLNDDISVQGLYFISLTTNNTINANTAALDNVNHANIIAASRYESNNNTTDEQSEYLTNEQYGYDFCLSDDDITAQLLLIPNIPILPLYNSHVTTSIAANPSLINKEIPVQGSQYFISLITNEPLNRTSHNTPYYHSILLMMGYYFTVFNICKSNTICTITAAINAININISTSRTITTDGIITYGLTLHKIYSVNHSVFDDDGLPLPFGGFGFIDQLTPHEFDNEITKNTNNAYDLVTTTTAAPIPGNVNNNANIAAVFDLDYDATHYQYNEIYHQYYKPINITFTEDENTATNAYNSFIPSAQYHLKSDELGALLFQSEATCCVSFQPWIFLALYLFYLFYFNIFDWRFAHRMTTFMIQFDTNTWCRQFIAYLMSSHALSILYILQCLLIISLILDTLVTSHTLLNATIRGSAPIPSTLAILNQLSTPFTPHISQYIASAATIHEQCHSLQSLHSIALLILSIAATYGFDAILTSCLLSRVLSGALISFAPHALPHTFSPRTSASTLPCTLLDALLLSAIYLLSPDAYFILDGSSAALIPSAPSAARGLSILYYFTRTYFRLAGVIYHIIYVIHSTRWYFNVMFGPYVPSAAILPDLFCICTSHTLSGAILAGALLLLIFFMSSEPDATLMVSIKFGLPAAHYLLTTHSSSPGAIIY